jgi:hypothetical protein
VMRLPPLRDPPQYAGLYVFDFGDHVSVGYTADEIRILLDSGRFRAGQAYRVHRAMPDGTIELLQVEHEALTREDGLLFYRHLVRDARRDFDQLVGLADNDPPPCRALAQLAKIHSAGPGYLTALIFPAESAGRISAWLEGIKFEGGDFVRGGPAEMSCYYGADPVVIDQREWAEARAASRSAQEVLATTDLAVQR